MFLLVLAHLGCPGQNPEHRKMVVCVCVCVCVMAPFVDDDGEDSSKVLWIFNLWIFSYYSRLMLFDKRWQNAI